MTKQICILLLCVLASFAESQAQNQDSTARNIIKKSAFYARSMPLGIYSGAGILQNRINQNIEIGKSFGALDLGLALGRTSLRTDTSLYLEARATLDAGQIGRLSNEFAIGAGKNFQSSTPLMLEVSSTIFAQIGTHWGVGVLVGYYDFSGKANDLSKNVYGIFFRYGLLRDDNGGLLSPKIHTHRHHR